jgi:hypothetical protein
MPRSETAFDALFRLARDLDIGFVSGPLQPPDAGRLILEGRSLAEILLPEWSGRRVALAIVPGGPGSGHVSLGTALLGAEAVARLVEATEDTGGHVYQGRLALLTPTDWLRTHEPSQREDEAPGALRDRGAWPTDNPATAEIASLDTGPLMAAARAAGWPATFANEPVLFLDDEPVYHLLMRESVGRVVTLLIGALETRERAPSYQ